MAKAVLAIALRTSGFVSKSAYAARAAIFAIPTMVARVYGMDFEHYPRP